MRINYDYRTNDLVDIVDLFPLYLKLRYATYEKTLFFYNIKQVYTHME